MDIVKDSLFKAAGFTVLMLFLGILVGLQMDDMRQDQLSEELTRSQLDSEMFHVMDLYSDRSEEDFCSVMEVQLPEIGERSGQLGSRLEQFEAQELGDGQEYDFIRRRYYNNQLRLFLSVSKYQDRCDTEQNTILYFFSGEGEDERRQGAVLNEVVKEKDTNVFSFNTEVDSPIVDLLEADFNVTGTPTLVVNGEKKLEGFVSQGELLNEYLN